MPRTLWLAVFMLLPIPVGAQDRPPFQIRLLGLTDTEHTSNTGHQGTFPFSVTDTGLVLATSERYNGGSTFRGWTAWVHFVDTNTTLIVAPIGSEYIRNDGYRDSAAVLGAGDKVYINALTYNAAGTGFGEASLIRNFSNNTVRSVGLFGPEHTDAQGMHGAELEYLLASGNAAGTSDRLSGSTHLGISVWYHDYVANTTTKLDLTDAAH